MNLALRSLQATQFQVHDLVCLGKDQSQQIERLMTKDNKKSQQIERLMAMVNDQSQRIERLMNKDKEKSQEIERLMAKVNDQSERIERFTSEQIKMQTTVVNTQASFAWKIPNIQAILDRSRDEVRVKIEYIVSEPFYLSENGYKLRIILKSKRSSLFVKEPHFAFCVRVVPGKFDQLLSWPFNEKVRVTLIDQNPWKDKREDISHVTDFRERSPTCPRPPYEKDDKFDFGGLIVTQDQLRTGSYVMDDAIFIRANKE